MTETREQFRERLAQILDAKYAEAFRTPEERSPWDVVRPEWKQKMGDMAEAVASQVLRDVVDAIEREVHPDERRDLYLLDEAVDAVRSFAAERGISLEDES